MVDKILDSIEVMLLKLRDSDQFKEKLYEEYKFYRELLESLPKSAKVPDELHNSIISLERRLKDYVVLGKTNNPLIDCAPTMLKRINSDDEVQKLLKQCNCNQAYMDGRKQKIEVLKAYLNGINLSSSKEDILAAIKLAKKGYDESNVYSNELEKEIAKAKYLYILKLLYEGNDEEAKEYIATIETDIIIVIYEKHKDSVNKLIAEGKIALAQKLNDFLVDIPQDMEKDIEFWKVLAKIEEPAFESCDNSDFIEAEYCDEVAENLQTPVVKKGFFDKVSSIFSKKELDVGKPIVKEDYSIALIEDGVEIRLKTYAFFEVQDIVFRNFLKDIQAGRLKFPRAFNNASLIIEEQRRTNPRKALVHIKLKEIFDELAFIFYFTNIIIYGDASLSHKIESGCFSKIHAENIKFVNGSWSFYKYCFAHSFIRNVDFSNITLNLLGECSFLDCMYLKTVKFPESMKDECIFGEGIFMECISLEKIQWPPYIRTIKKNTFLGCSKLKEISSAFIEEIGDCAFRSCKSLESINYSNKIMSIGKQAFYNCKLLISFHFNESCIVGDYAFQDSGILSAKLNLPNTNPPIGVFKGSAIIEAKISGSNTLPEEFFEGCKHLKKVELDQYINRIEDNAFCGCEILSELIAPRPLIYVGIKAFMNCFSLRHITLCQAQCTLLKCAFMNCKSLKSIQIPPMDSIPQEAFKNCIELEEVEFSSDTGTVANIEDEAFRYCIRLKKFDFRDGICKIGNNAFESTNLVSLIMPDSISEIGEGAFAECRCLEKVRLSSRIRTIEVKTFFNCVRLKECYLIDSFIDKICDFAFAGCDAIKTLSFGRELEAMNRVFSDLKSIGEIIIPKDVISLSEVDDFSDLTKILRSISLIHYVVKDFKIIGDKVYISVK